MVTFKLAVVIPEEAGSTSGDAVTLDGILEQGPHHKGVSSVIHKNWEGNLVSASDYEDLPKLATYALPSYAVSPSHTFWKAKTSFYWQQIVSVGESWSGVGFTSKSGEPYSGGYSVIVCPVTGGVRVVTWWDIPCLNIVGYQAHYYDPSSNTFWYTAVCDTYDEAATAAGMSSTPRTYYPVGIAAITSEEFEAEVAVLKRALAVDRIARSYNGLPEDWRGRLALDAVKAIKPTDVNFIELISDLPHAIETFTNWRTLSRALKKVRGSTVPAVKRLFRTASQFAKSGKWRHMRKADLKRVKHILSSVVPLKELSSSYLQYVFGVLPTVRDIQQLGKLREGLQEYYERHGIRTRRSYDLTSRSQPGITGLAECSYRIKLDTDSFYGSTLAVNPFTDIGDIYEAIPWSFAVDWFINLGSVFDRAAARNSLCALPIEYVLSSLKVSFTYTPQDLVPNSRLRGSIVDTRYQRGLSLLPDFPALWDTKEVLGTQVPLITAGALLIQRLG
jgi:hypothetical protein